MYDGKYFSAVFSDKEGNMQQTKMETSVSSKDVGEWMILSEGVQV